MRPRIFEDRLPYECLLLDTHLVGSNFMVSTPRSPFFIYLDGCSVHEPAAERWEYFRRLPSYFPPFWRANNITSLKSFMGIPNDGHRQLLYFSRCICGIPCRALMTPHRGAFLLEQARRGFTRDGSNAFIGVTDGPKVTNTLQPISTFPLLKCSQPKSPLQYFVWFVSELSAGATRGNTKLVSVLYI
ncbi:hypothetical protein K437DRAFT_257104 [Tilletiaria anomala UBC 951]|uniref:Uncharacterized protein n=1 Tax=Tilletiaria anomala (strain ATCC 24038 / CBS 436.72 / UBC 951) TaxID=1037660 RepID=A0A066VR67_TILAU|nr:uncharacterized protein K437DRAFT_257104 [Tilletiaria anomala UBC 951]KDN44237.1 hypothetical protein K437DRAFT_257104 [Tilletiaria anomala UBC 951]